MKRLANCGLFQNLSEENFNKIQELGTKEQFEAESVLFKKGDPAENFYVVLEGILQISTPDPLGERNKTLALLGPGEFVGEMAILTDQNRSGRATPLSDTTLFVLSKETFTSLFHEIPQIGLNLSTLLCERLAETDIEVQSVAFKSVEGRLANQFKKLEREFGKDTDEGRLIDIELTHKKLGDLVGSHRETVSRHLKNMIEKGIVSYENSRIKILNYERLEELSAVS